MDLYIGTKFTLLIIISSVISSDYVRGNSFGSSETISVQGIESLLRNAGRVFHMHSDSSTVPQHSLHPPDQHSFNFYLPPFENDQQNEKLDAKSSAMLNLNPPIQSIEPNYYTTKPKKTAKKYIPGEKHVNVKLEKTAQNLHTANIPEKSKWSIYEKSFLQEDTLASDPDDNIQHFNSGIMNGFVPMVSGEEMTASESQQSYNGLRNQFQFRGLNGPESYKFGYDTGKGKDSHFRVEERDNIGNVNGQYGYVDSEGHMTVVKYSSTINKGFQILE